MSTASKLVEAAAVVADAQGRLDAAKQLRDDLVVTRIREGASVREVAREAGLSPAATARIGQREMGTREAGRRPAAGGVAEDGTIGKWLFVGSEELPWKLLVGSVHPWLGSTATGYATEAELREAIAATEASHPGLQVREA